MPIGLTTSGNVIFRERTTVTLGGGGTRGGAAVVPQPTTPSPMIVVIHEKTGSKTSLAASVVLVSRIGIMSVNLQQIAMDAPDGASNGTFAPSRRQLMSRGRMVEIQ